MSSTTEIDKILSLAAQQIQAGYPSWKRIKAVLQISIASDSSTTHWSYDLNTVPGFQKTSVLNNNQALAEISAEVFYSILLGELNIQQAYLDGRIKLFGSVADTMFYTRLFNDLSELASSNFDSEKSN